MKPGIISNTQELKGCAVAMAMSVGAWIVIIATVVAIVMGGDARMFVFAVAALFLPGLFIGFWLGQRARVARMSLVGVVDFDEDGYAKALWARKEVPRGAALYVEGADWPTTVSTRPPEE